MIKIQRALRKSKFRSSFKLNNQDRAYIEKTGLIKLEEHAEDFVRKRLAPSLPKNDGKQTPFKGHPVFKAQHATATCCRGCLYKWYKISENKQLNKSEIQLIKDIIMSWIKEELNTSNDE